MKYCKKCGAVTERYSDGKCKPCKRGSALARQHEVRTPQPRLSFLKELSRLVEHRDYKKIPALLRDRDDVDMGSRAFMGRLLIGDAGALTQLGYSEGQANAVMAAQRIWGLDFPAAVIARIRREIAELEEDAE